MATRRTAGKRRTSSNIKKKPERVDDDLALAEELLRGAREDPAEVAAQSKKLWKELRELGIHAKPIGAKKLREMAIREGLDPEGTEFSRGIIEMHEE